MSNNSTEIENWVVCASGFWREGAVSLCPDILAFFKGTWAQVYARHNEMRVMASRHRKERHDLRERQTAEHALLYGKGGP